MKYIATIPEKDKKIAYLLCKDKKILIPMELRDDSCFIYPKLKNTCESILYALKARIILSKIYKYQNGIFYTYIRIKRGYGYIDINTSPLTALGVSRLFGVPLLISEDIVKDKGFYITKKMIEDAFNKDLPV